MSAAAETLREAAGQPDPWANEPWWCPRCKTKHRDGDPQHDTCPDCGWSLGDRPPVTPSDPPF